MFFVSQWKIRKSETLVKFWPEVFSLIFSKKLTLLEGLTQADVSISQRLNTSKQDFWNWPDG